jgi:MinD-like ATPase involved in chromosome partitioning or flagellar assembly
MAKIVSVHSYRGGTGKSNISANLAAAIARQGRRVCLVDTDIQSPGVHVLFGFDAETVGPSLNDYLWGKCRIEETAHDVSAVLQAGSDDAPPASSALYLLPASIKAGQIARVLREGYDVELLSDGLDELAGRLELDYVFVDTHPGLYEETLSCIANSDLLLLILRPDQQDYQGTAVTVEVARKLDVPEMLLAINKVLPRLDAAALREQVERTYRAPVAGILPVSEELMHLASNGIFGLRYPDHEWSREVRAIAGQVAG